MLHEFFQVIFVLLLQTIGKVYELVQKSGRIWTIDANTESNFLALSLRFNIIDRAISNLVFLIIVRGFFQNVKDLVKISSFAVLLK